MEDSEEETHPVVEVDAEKGAVEVDAEKGATDKGPKKKAELLRKHTSMQSSVLRFKNIDFAVGSNDNKKLILDDVSGTVKWGRVLAIMGPSGAGKTTLISALTLDAHFGKASGTVTLNQVPLTGPIFKKHCFVVKQRDKHWPYLTLTETLTYAAGLYDVSDSKEKTAIVVNDIIEKMGLNGCAETRCSRLSGGQQRRLSIAVALLKEPTVLFLDEPTSGLDAAAASNIMQEIDRVAKDEKLVIVCTIHQPSTKVYNGFDQVMILSRGREAFMGDVGDAAPYFESIGHPMPENTNPAEHFLDLVNSDFSGEEDVTKILDQWAVTKGANPSTHGANPSTHPSNKNGDDSNVGADRVDDSQDASSLKEVSIMFRRHFTLIRRDPILYVGRCVIFLVSCSVFAFVYWNAREFDIDQIYNKMWVQVWFAGVPTNMGVVAVYALNDEFKSIQRESQNGMLSAGSYVFAKSLLTLPILFMFSLFALLIPNYVIQDVPWSAFGLTLCLYAANLFVYESVAEALSVLFDNPILGMLQFMNFWFAGFLFGGFLIGEDSLIWPFRLFFYIMPFGPYLRSTMYVTISESDWGDLSTDQVFDDLNDVYPLIENKNRVAEDIGIIVAIGCFYKILYIVAVFVKTRQQVKQQGD